MTEVWRIGYCGKCAPVAALLVCTDGWNAYPGSIRRAFREKVKETVGRGRACLRVGPQLCIGVVLKRTEKKRVVEITRKLVPGTLEHVQALFSASHGATVLNTAITLRFNGSATSTYLLTLSEATHKEVCW